MGEVSYIRTQQYTIKNIEPSTLARFATVVQEISDRRLQTANIVGLKTAFTEPEWDLDLTSAIVVVRANTEVHAVLSQIYTGLVPQS